MKLTELNIPNLFRIAPIGRAFAELAKYPGGFNFNAFQDIWKSVLVADLGKIFIVENEAGEIQGALGCMVFPDTFSGNPTATEHFWFVHPEARSNGTGMLLWNAYENYAKEKGCNKLLMVHLVGENLPDLTTLFEKRGYKLSDKTFCKLI